MANEPIPKGHAIDLAKRGGLVGSPSLWPGRAAGGHRRDPSLLFIAVITASFAVQDLGFPRDEIVARGHDRDAPELLPEVRTEVSPVSRDEMRGLGGDGRLENGDVFLGELDSFEELDRTLRDHLEASNELLEAGELLVRVEVPPGFLEGIRRGEEIYVLELPEPEKTGAFTVGGREEDVGVEEEPLHVEALGCRPFVRDGIGVEAHLPDFLMGPLIVLAVDHVLQEERGAAFLGVDLDGQRDGGPKQEALGSFLHQDFPSLL